MALRTGAIALMLHCFAFGSAETLIAEAKVLEFGERKITLQVGTEKLVVEDTSSTKFWFGRAAKSREALASGLDVMVRIKSDANPPQLREIADRPTWAWLDRVRKEPQEGQILKADGKSLILQLGDGSAFTYRFTEKTKIDFVKGDPSQSSALKAGTRVFVKGRLLSNLDTWAAEIKDVPYPAKATASKGKAKPTKLAASGSFECTILGLMDPIDMLDVLVNLQTFHLTVNLDTQWRMAGKKVGPEALRRGQTAKITYKRDKFGRIVATRVDLSP